jgi:hypothetical protein
VTPSKVPVAVASRSVPLTWVVTLNPIRQAHPEPYAPAKLRHSTGKFRWLGRPPPPTSAAQDNLRHRTDPHPPPHHTPPCASPAPLGDGAQLRVTRNGHLIAYCLSPDYLPALGVDMSRMAVVARW